jgi:hypothetical protein
MPNLSAADLESVLTKETRDELRVSLVSRKQMEMGE